MGKGIIYVFYNDSMPGLVKIGRTNNIKERLRQLDNTSIPTPFCLHYAVEVDDYEDKENNIHLALAPHRVRDSREFFRVARETAVAALKITGGKEVDTEYNNISIDEEGREVSAEVYEKKLPNKPKTDFEKLGISVGSILELTRNLSIKCEVINSKEVKYNDEIASLSRITSKIMECIFGWKHDVKVNGFEYWEYEEEILTERRSRLESENAEKDMEL